MRYLLLILFFTIQTFGFGANADELQKSNVKKVLTQKKSDVEARSTLPFAFQGQMYDADIELAYNRFRYYNPEDGRYISKDPIRLLSWEDNFYAYVNDPNDEIDILGLNNISTGAGRDHVKYSGISNGKPYSGYASTPSKINLTPEQIVARRYRGKKNKPKNINVDYQGKNIREKNTARGLEEMGAGKGFDNAQRPVGDRNPKKDKYKRAAERHLRKKVYKK